MASDGLSAQPPANQKPCLKWSVSPAVLLTKMHLPQINTPYIHLSGVKRNSYYTFFVGNHHNLMVYRQNNTVCHRYKLFGTFLYTDGLAYGSNEYHICFLDGPCYKVHPTKYAHRCVVHCFVWSHNDSRALSFRLAKPASGQRINKKSLKVIVWDIITHPCSKYVLIKLSIVEYDIP